MLFIALPVPVIVANFTYYYSKERRRESIRGDVSSEKLSSAKFRVLRSLVRCSTVNRQDDSSRIHKHGKATSDNAENTYVKSEGPSEGLLEDVNGHNAESNL